jgi:gluconate kinase
MRNGIPLDDNVIIILVFVDHKTEADVSQDRIPWLQSIRLEAMNSIKHQTQGLITAHRTICVVACSALKRRYRDILRECDYNMDEETVRTCFVYCA